MGWMGIEGGAPRGYTTAPLIGYDRSIGRDMKLQHPLIILLVLVLITAASACQSRENKNSEYQKLREQREAVEHIRELEEQEEAAITETDAEEACEGVSEADIVRVEERMKNLQGELVILDAADMKALGCSRSRKK